MPFVRSKADPSGEIGFGWKPNRNQTSPSRIALPLPRRAARRGAQCSGERIVQSARLPLPRSGRREIPHHKNSGLDCQFDFPHPAR